MKPVFLVAFFAVILFSSPAFAWWNHTHILLAQKVCNDFDCNCLDEISYGANYPDDVLYDYVNHHCYNESWDCSESDKWNCPTKFNCPAGEKINLWLEKAKNDSSCDKWFDVGVAAHYFFDTKVFWHNVRKESSYCHSGFEKKADTMLLDKKTNWEIEHCGISLKYEELPEFVSEFETLLEENGIGEKTKEVPLVETECGLTCKLVRWVFWVLERF